MKNTNDYLKDWNYMTADIKDKFECRIAIKSHLLRSFGYTEKEAFDCIAFNLASENKRINKIS